MAVNWLFLGPEQTKHFGHFFALFWHWMDRTANQLNKEVTDESIRNLSSICSHASLYRVLISYLPGQLWEEVLVGGEGPQAVQVADGGRQRLQLITTTVQLLQQRQTGWNGRRGRKEEMQRKVTETERKSFCRLRNICHDLRLLRRGP